MVKSAVYRELGADPASPGMEIDRCVLARDLDQVVGLVTCERGTKFRLQQTGKAKRVVKQAKEIAMGHDFE